MSQVVSPSLNKRYGLAMVCRLWGVPRSTVYAQRRRRDEGVAPKKRGPKTKWTDAQLLKRIRQIIEDSPFHGEGHRKVWARLRSRQVRTSKKRTLRIMGENGLLGPQRVQSSKKKEHKGTIIPEHPDQMWGTDATTTLTLQEGNATIFIGVDHATAECVGIHAAKEGNRFEALEPIRQGVRCHLKGYEKGIARGLSLRHDHGSVYTSGVFQGELTFLGIDSSPAFVREPEGNGCAERFIRLLKEQLLWLRDFETVEDLRVALLEFKELYNKEWLIARHGYLTPAEARIQKMVCKEEAA